MKTPDKHTIFISYSPQDQDWKNRIVSHLAALEKQGMIDVWDDPRLGAGEDWYPATQKAIDSARIAILLISADYLTSQYLLKKEIPHLLEIRQQRGLSVIPVLVSQCLWQEVAWLRSIQIFPAGARPLSILSAADIEGEMVKLVKLVSNILSSFPTSESSRDESAEITYTTETIEREGKLFAVPKLPPHYVSRDHLFQELRARLLGEAVNVADIHRVAGVGLDNHIEGTSRAYRFTVCSR